MKPETKAHKNKVESMKRLRAAYIAALENGTVKRYEITHK